MLQSSTIISSMRTSREAQASSSPFVSVIISHRNSARTIGNCVSHLLSQNYPSNRYDIWVIDGGSNDQSADIVNSLGSSKVHQIIVPGCREAEGQNIGISKSNADIIMFTNSDIYAPDDWIKKHVSWLQSGYDLVGGKGISGGDKYTFTWNIPKPGKPNFACESGMGLAFANCSVWKDFLLRVGGISQISMQQDLEFTLRSVKARGKLIIDPSIETYHDHPLGSVRAALVKSYIYGHNHAVVIKSSYGKLVSGSGTPVAFKLDNLFSELFQVRGTKTYYEYRNKGKENGIRISLFEFLVIRFLGLNLGNFIGLFTGAIAPRIKSVLPSSFKR
jgi:glycosyltransferase involved in cell wall biosynthesis